ncbi:MAG: sugar ABC transporter permease [Dehalococcoidales bacterium]|nr:sugar ABC transporter permease [Dehalococcoidales bacterium]
MIESRAAPPSQGRIGRLSLQNIFSDRNARYIMPAPAVIAIMLMMVFPVAYTFWLSFYDWFASAPQGPQFIGLQNYQKLIFEDTRFQGAFVRTFIFTGSAIAIQTVLGIAMALAFNQEFKGRGVLRTLFLLPMMATPVAVSLVWLMMFDPSTGLLNYILSWFGINPSLWVADPNIALYCIVIVDSWKFTPLMMLIVLAGLSALPPEPYESAVIDGANSVQLFWYITLPLLRPVIMVALLFRSIDALKTFDSIFVITRGGPMYASETLNVYGFLSAFQYFNMGYSSALLVIFFIVVMVVSLVFMRLRRVSW